MWWPDGTNDAYDIEVADGKGYVVVIPDVLSIRTTRRFVIGRADWKYIEGYGKTSAGIPVTNEFWFALDKGAAYPKCYASVTTNKQHWIAWCVGRNVPTNLLQVSNFLDFAETNQWHGGEHRL